MLSFWGFLILLFLICFFRHFAIQISVDYRICYEQSVRCQEEDHDHAISTEPNFLRRKSIFSVENYHLRDFCVDICTNILHF